MTNKTYALYSIKTNESWLKMNFMCVEEQIFQ